MAMLRRLDGPVCAVRAGSAHDLPGLASRTCDWPLQNLRMDSDSRVDTMRCQRFAREAWQEEQALGQTREAAMQAERLVQLAQAAELQEALAGELEKRRRQEVNWDARVHQATSSSTEVRSLQSRCLNEQAFAERSLQVLMEQVVQEEARQLEAAERDAQKLARLRADEAAVRHEAARRDAGRDRLNDLSAQAASRRATQLAQLQVEQQEDRARADEVAARNRDDDLRQLAAQQRSQAQLHAALDDLVEKRRWQSYQEIALDIEQDQEAQEFELQKSGFAEKLAMERKCAEESRQRVLSDLASALRADQLRAHVAEELCEAIRHEELQVKERQQGELRLRQRLERRMAGVQACKESIRLLEERRSADAKERERERQELLEKYAKDDKLELLGEQRRRMKQLAHARDIEQMLKDRRAREEQERGCELEQLQAKMRDEQHVAVVIQEERRRLLQAYGLYKPAEHLGQLLRPGACKPSSQAVTQAGDSFRWTSPDSGVIA